MRWRKKWWKRDGSPANCSGSCCLICLLSKVAMMWMKISIWWRGGKRKQRNWKTSKHCDSIVLGRPLFPRLVVSYFYCPLPSPGPLVAWTRFRHQPAPPRPIPLLVSRKFLVDRLCIESRTNTGLLWLLWRKNADCKICAMCTHHIGPGPLG